MKLFGLFFKIVWLMVFAFLGNWAGEMLRYIITGEKGHEALRVQNTPTGESVIVGDPLWTNILPGIAFSLLGRPRWWYAFIGGAASSFVMGEQYEKEFLELVEETSNR
jgi:hypothetical protein